MRPTPAMSEVAMCRGKGYLARLGGLLDHLPFRVALIVAPPGYNDDLVADAVARRHPGTSTRLDVTGLDGGIDGVFPTLGRLLDLDETQATLDRLRERLQATTTLLTIGNLSRVVKQDRLDAIRALLPRPGDRWATLLSSSVHPGFDLTAYHAAGTALVVSANELRYRVEEVAELLDSVGAIAADPESLHDLTFGWPVAVETMASLLRMGWSEDDALVQLGVEVEAHLDANVGASLHDRDRRAVEIVAVLGEVDADTRRIVGGRDLDDPLREWPRLAIPTLRATDATSGSYVLSPLVARYFLTHRSLTGSRSDVIRRIIQHYLDADDFQRAGTWATRHGDVETARDLRRMELLSSAFNGEAPPENPEGLTDDVIDLAAVNALAGIVRGDLDATDLWARWHRSRTGGTVGPEEGTLGVFLSAVLGLAPAPPASSDARNRPGGTRAERDVRFAITELARADAALAKGDLPLAVQSYRVIGPLIQRLPTLELWRNTSLALIHAIQRQWLEAASALARADERVVETRGNPLWVGRDAARALLAQRAGDATGAHDHLTAAVAGLRRFERFDTVLTTTQFAACLALAPLAAAVHDTEATGWLHSRTAHLVTMRPGLARLHEAIGAHSDAPAQVVNPDPAPAPRDAESATTLTPAELRVLAQLDSHLKVPEIARELCVSAATVRTHTALIYKKLGVHSRSGAVVAAQRLGLLGTAHPLSGPAGATRQGDHRTPLQRPGQPSGRR